MIPTKLTAYVTNKPNVIYMLDLKLKHHTKFLEKIQASCQDLKAQTAFAVSTILAIMVQDDPNIKIEDIEQFTNQCGENLSNYLKTLPQTLISNLGEEQYILLATEALGIKKPNEVKLRENLEEKDVEEATLEYAIENIKYETSQKITEETSKMIKDSVIDEKKQKVSVGKLQQLLKEMRSIITLINEGNIIDLIDLLKKIKDGQQKKINSEMQKLSKYVEAFKRFLTDANKKRNSLFGSITGMLAGAALGIAFGPLSLIAIPALGLAGSIAGRRMGDIFDQEQDLSPQDLFAGLLNDFMDDPVKMLSLVISAGISAGLTALLGPIALIASPYLLEAGIDIGEELFGEQEIPQELSQFTDIDINTPGSSKPEVEERTPEKNISEVINQSQLLDIQSQLGGVAHIDEIVEHGKLNPNKSATDMVANNKEDKELSL